MASSILGQSRKALFHCLFLCEGTEIFLERRIRAFCFYSGVPHRIRYENAQNTIASNHRGVFITHYNIVRLHSAISYVMPADELASRERLIFAGGVVN
jgi:hypothetical protein